MMVSLQRYEKFTVHPDIQYRIAPQRDTADNRQKICKFVSNKRVL